MHPQGGYDPSTFESTSVETFAGKLGIGGRQGDRKDYELFNVANPGLADRMEEHCWRLVGLGFLVPTRGISLFRPTARGAIYLETLDLAAVVRGGVDEAMDRLGFAFDDLPRFYARLAQGCFLDGHNEAAIVMLGAAVEGLVRDVTDSLSKLAPAIMPNLRKRGSRPTASANLRWLRDALEEHGKEIEKAMAARGAPQDWIHALRSVLPIGEAIRLTRNDYGHPTMGVAAATRDETLQFFVVFPRFARACVEATNAMS